MKRQDVGQREPPPANAAFSRRSAIGAFAAAMAISNFSPLAISSSRSEQDQGAINMKQYVMSKETISDAVSGGGLLVVAEWEAKQGQADKVADILQQFLPEAQREYGVKLFLISQARDNPAQFLFYELFRDEAAFAEHQQSPHFKTYIAEQALPLLARRERTQYALL
ncbi:MULTISPECIES: putative quinol monooxygenase [unclassified Bradyrhizobium]|uniref:putative quinol monooxygenase n=1 Tax=unclassified Bradyrhizobium TaxID=2631580 RepID=UPI002FEF8B82